MTDERPADMAGAPGAPEATEPVICMPLAPLPVPSSRIAVTGTAVWVALLVLTLIVPALHEGERSWWPWACVAGVGLGLFAYLYIRRGRGNAVAA